MISLTNWQKNKHKQTLINAPIQQPKRKQRKQRHAPHMKGVLFRSTSTLVFYHHHNHPKQLNNNNWDSFYEDLKSEKKTYKISLTSKAYWLKVNKINIYTTSGYRGCTELFTSI